KANTTPSPNHLFTNCVPLAIMSLPAGQPQPKTATCSRNQPYPPVLHDSTRQHPDRQPTPPRTTIGLWISAPSLPRFPFLEDGSGDNCPVHGAWDPGIHRHLDHDLQNLLLGAASVQCGVDVGSQLNPGMSQDHQGRDNGHFAFLHP